MEASLIQGKTKSYKESFAFWSLAVLLPIRHLYQYLGAAGYVPFAEGAIVLPPLLLLVPLTLSFLSGKKTFPGWVVTWLFVSLSVYAATLIVLSPNPLDELGRSPQTANLKILIYYWIYFLIGWNGPNLTRHQKAIIVLWVFMCVNLFLHLDLARYRISFKGFSEGYGGMYLFFGDSFALWSLLLLSVIRRRPFISAGAVFLSVIALFALNSRTSLYAFVLILPVYFCLNRKSFKYFLLLFLTFFILSALSGTMTLETLRRANARMFAIQALDNDGSVILRRFMQEKGLEALGKNWFWGDYAGQLAYSNLGGYIHNYLSLWRQWGLFPFAIFLAFAAQYIVVAWQFFWNEALRRFSISPTMIFLILGGGFCLVENIASRSYGYPYIWMFFGMSACIPFLGKNLKGTTCDVNDCTLQTSNVQQCCVRDPGQYSR